MAIPTRFNVTTQDAYNYAASKFFADQQLCMVLKIGGKLNQDTLNRAIRLTLDLEPVLCCRLVEGTTGPFWERRSDIDQLELCRLVETSQLLEAFINQPIYAYADPLITTRIFREKQHDTLCIKANHSACDAGGLKEYSALLSNLYSTLAAGKQYSPEPNLGGRRDQSQVFQRTVDPRTLAMKSFPTPTWVFPQKEGTEPLHTFQSLPQTKLETIKAYARTKNATVNDLLLTAFYRTFFALNNTPEGKPMIHQTSIDLRRYLPNRKAEAICNLSGALYTALERKQGETFEGTLRRVCAAMNKLKENYPGLESAAGLEYLYSQGYAGLLKYLGESAAMSKKYNLTFPLLSNFGVLSDYCFGELRTMGGFVSSPVMYQPGFMLGASTCNSELTLSVGYRGQENTKNVNNFLHAFTAELPS